MESLKDFNRKSRQKQYKDFLEIFLDLYYSSWVPVSYCPCPMSDREGKNDATETEISVESQIDPTETDTSRK